MQEVENFINHTEYTTYFENRGRALFQQYFDNSTHWINSTIEYTQNQYDNYDGIITKPSGKRIMLEIKARSKPRIELLPDIRIAQNKIDWIADNYPLYDCKDFLIAVIEPTNKCMYIVHKDNYKNYYSNLHTWSIAKNKPDPTLTVEFVYSYKKTDLLKIEYDFNV